MNTGDRRVTAFFRPAFVRAAIGALFVASSGSAFGEARPPLIGERPQAVSVLVFRVLVREYLEFRVGSQVTIRSNAGRVVITATDYRARSDAIASALAVQDAPARSAAESPPKPVIPAAGVVAEADRRGSTSVCLYLEGSEPACGDLSEVAGQVIYTASNP